MNIESIKKKRWVKYLLGIIVTSVILLTFGRPILYSGLSLIFRDIPPLDDSELVLSKIQIPRKENVYYDLMQASSSAPVLSDDFTEIMSNYKKYLSDEMVLDKMKVSSLLTQYAGALTSLEGVRTRTTYQYPPHEDPANISAGSQLPSLNFFRNISLLYVLKALTLYHEGRVDEGIEGAFVIVRLGSLIQNSPNPSLIEVMVGVAIEGFGLDVLEKIVADTNTTRIQKERIARAVAQYQGVHDGAVHAMKYEYMLAKDSIHNISQPLTENSPKPNQYLFQPNRTIGYFIDQTKNNIVMITSSCDTLVSVPETKKFFEKNVSPIKLAVSPNSIGKILADVHSGQLNSFKEKLCTQEERMNAMGLVQ
jgi:hypothetical protein